MTKQATTKVTNEIAVQMARILSMKMVMVTHPNVVASQRLNQLRHFHDDALDLTLRLRLAASSPMKAGGTRHGKCHRLESCAGLRWRWTRHLSRPITIGPKVRKPAQRIFKPADCDAGPAFQCRKFFSVVKRAGADRG